MGGAWQPWESLVATRTMSRPPKEASANVLQNKLMRKSPRNKAATHRQLIQKADTLVFGMATFAQAFPNDPEPVKPEHWGKAIGAYERTLITPSPFDAYLKGDAKALPIQAQNGLKAFIEVGCVSCHNGVGVGGSSFQKFRVLEDCWKKTGSQPIDEGRFTHTQHPADKYFFKVLSLRNVAMTPPYFYDGSVATLSQAVRVMRPMCS